MIIAGLGLFTLGLIFSSYDVADKFHNQGVPNYNQPPKPRNGGRDYSNYEKNSDYPADPTFKDTNGD